MAEAYRRSETYNPGVVDTRAPEVFGSLVDRFRAFNQVVMQPIVESQQREVRAYVLGQYADVTANMAKIEAEAGTDLGKFQAMAKGYEDGVLRNTDSRARATVGELIQKQAAERGARIATAKVEQDRETAKSEIVRGLKAQAGEISRLLTSGDEARVVEAQGLLDQYRGHIQDSVNDGTFSPAEGMRFVDESLKAGVRDVTFGMLDKAVAENRDPITVVEGALKTPGFSDPERVELATQALQRLDLHQKMARERAGSDTSLQKLRYEEGEKAATLDLLRGKLTIGKLDALVADDRLDPTVARTLRNEMKTGDSGADDPQRKFAVETSLLDYTEQQIGTMQGLSWSTRADLITKRRAQVGRWPDTNPAQEARARIDRSLGIVPGTNQMVDERKGRQRGEAMTDWFNRVEALPEADRERSAIAVAEQVITERIRGNRAQDAERQQRSLDKYLEKAGDPGSMSKSERAAYDAEVAKRKTRIDALRREAGK